jgi:hypothetical protein
MTTNSKDINRQPIQPDRCINLDMKLVGKPGAGKPHAGFDVAGAGDRVR